MTFREIFDAARAAGFGPVALALLVLGRYRPINPYDALRYSSMRQDKIYGYFARLEAAGYIREVPAPTGRRGKWYRTACAETTGGK